jgi:adenosine kinase
VGVDTSHVHHVRDKFTASFFCSTDTENNQIASFYIGAMANASELSLRTIPQPDLVIISPNDPGAMIQYAEECRTIGVPFIFDPGQQCARLSGDELRDGIRGARLVICNDYEFELVRQKTGLAEDTILQQAAALVITRGEDGCSIYDGSGRANISALTPHRIVDPTGVGDAFRGGLMKGMAGGKSLKECAQLGTVAATYALEHLGGQSHAYTMQEFSERYGQHFGPLSL